MKLSIRTLFMSVVLFYSIPVASLAVPRILYTDILRGPNNKGEDSFGTYLSIFGTGFGEAQATSIVTINDTEVSAYKYWGKAINGLSHIEQITVQPGPSVTTGSIDVIVNGLSSNLDQVFTVDNDGDIYFVSLTGNNDTGIANDINQAYRHVQHVIELSNFGADDTVVVRGGEWTDLGGNGYNWWRNDSLSGASTGHIAFLTYPGEVVEETDPVNRLYKHLGGGDHYFVVSGFKRTADIDLAESAISANGNHIRWVNLDLYGLRSTRLGMINGKGKHWKLLGCKIHGWGGSSGHNMAHGFYSGLEQDGTSDTEDYEIAYSEFYDAKDGRGIQLSESGDYGPDEEIKNMVIHHNYFHDFHDNAVRFGQACSSGLKAYNNVFINVPNLSEGDSGALSFSGHAYLPTIAEVYNNTFVWTDGGVSGGDNDLIQADNLFPGSSITWKNNIHYLGTNVYWSGFDYFDNVPDDMWTMINNLYFGGGAGPAQEPEESRHERDPRFVNIDNNDARLQSDSPAIDSGAAIVIVTDFDGNPRPMDGDSSGTAEVDIGAFEYTGEYIPDDAAPAPPNNLSIVLD